MSRIRTSAVGPRGLQSSLLGALTALTVILALALPALAQEHRPRIVVGVLASGSVPEDLVRDVQDLFVTALAENSAYEIADRDAVFAMSRLSSDVDLLLCVNQPECLREMHDEQRFEQYVLVKVEEKGDNVAFSTVTFNFENTKTIEFSEPISVPSNDLGALIDRAFEAADQVQLVPVGTSEDVKPPEKKDCSAMTCDEGMTCEQGECIAQEVVELPPEPAGLDWRLIAGYSLAAAGGVSAILAIVFYNDAADTRDTYSSSYVDNGEILVSDLTQKQGHKDVAEIESGATAYQASAIAASLSLVSGAGLLAWYYLMPGPGAGFDEPDEASVQVAPMVGQGLAGVSAAFTF